MKTLKTLLSSVQWMFFILMGSIVVPIAIAGSFGMSGEAQMGFLSRTLFVLGIAGILQSLIGHRLPIQEGPAGIWWGVFSLYASLAIELYGSMDETLKMLSFCMIVSGVLFIVLAITGMIDRISKLFTPTVMGVYLISLCLQMSKSFMAGMAGVTPDHPTINVTVLILSILTIVSTFVFTRIKAISTYATLASIVFGWLLFIIFKQAPAIPHITSVFSLPKPMPFGMPTFDASMVVNAIFLTLLLLTNLLASISSVQLVFKKMNEPYDPNPMKKAGIASGIIHLLAGTFGAIGTVPIASTSAFIDKTKNTNRIPFIIGNVLIIISSFFPPIVAVFSALPIAVGYAALVPTFGFGTIAIALDRLDSVEDKATRNLAAGAAWFLGTGIMFLPPTAFGGMNPLLRTILSNGLIVGAIMAVCIDQVLTRKKKKQLATTN